jgi:hypothetical protein
MARSTNLIYDTLQNKTFFDEKAQPTYNLVHIISSEIHDII